MADRRQQKRQRKERKRREQQRQRAHRPRGTIELGEFQLTPPSLAHCAQPIHLDAALQRIEDPLERLGLGAEQAADPDAVRAAWRRALEQHPPEREPDTARLITAARDRLLSPERALERHLGVLHPPDPRAHGLPTEPPAEREPDPRLSARRRLLAQLAIYALLEQELEPARAPEQPKNDRHEPMLPFD